MFFFWLPAWACLCLAVPSLHAQMSDDDKRKLFLRAREDIRPVPRASASATPRPKPKTVSTPSPTPEPTPRSTPRPAATPKGDATPDVIELEPAPTPTQGRSRPSPTPEEKSDDTPSRNNTSRETPQPTPPQIPKGKTAAGDRIDAPILIEKSGLVESEGEEPAPKSTGGWFRRWRYLTPSVRKAIDTARVQKGRWKYIIVHNSGTRQGNARIFDTYHRRVRKMQNGLAYHFVIGNGSSSGDGEIEIGPRWTKQLNGGHVASDYLNDISIGICFVGDLNRDLPTKAQLAALDELIVYLRGRVGKIKGKQAIVVPHKKINPKPTDCPGDKFPYKWLQQRFGN